MYCKVRKGKERRRIKGSGRKRVERRNNVRKGNKRGEIM